ncbi:MAG: hypothetical protein ACF8OB_12085 [Phycisphaeraceae bacterium JB051]
MKTSAQRIVSFCQYWYTHAIEIRNRSRIAARACDCINARISTLKESKRGTVHLNPT